MESQCNAVIRGLQDRKTWDKAWARFMRSAIIKINPQKLNIIDIDFGQVNLPSLEVDCNFQRGGMIEAQATLEDFFSTRGQDYYKLISKPHKSRSSCSRMSAYIAYGNISIRQIYQKNFRKLESGGMEKIYGRIVIKNTLALSFYPEV